MHLYEIFQPFCGTPPKRVKTTLSNNKTYYGIVFDTLSYAAFNNYHEMFYVNKVKIVPNDIGDHLTARALAYWAMDDGNDD